MYNLLTLYTELVWRTTNQRYTENDHKRHEQIWRLDK